MHNKARDPFKLKQQREEDVVIPVHFIYNWKLPYF